LLSPGEVFAVRLAFSAAHRVRFTNTGARPVRRKQPSIASLPMHFRSYLMIAVLFLVGLEAIYSLYQLAMFVL
jgi:hypothetical protein